MKIMLKNVDMAYDVSVERTAQKVAMDFDIIVIVTGNTGGMGWPTVHLIGTPRNLIRALTDEEGGWSTGDEEQDAEMLYFYMQQAEEVYG